MYLGINLIKEVNNLYNENIKSFKKIKQGSRVSILLYWQN